MVRLLSVTSRDVREIQARNTWGWVILYRSISRGVLWGVYRKSRTGRPLWWDHRYSKEGAVSIWGDMELRLRDQ